MPRQHAGRAVVGSTLACFLLLTGCSPVADTPATRADAAPLVGEAPIAGNRTFVVDDHGYALPYWVANEVRSATVVHVDAHDDFRAISDERMKRLLQAAAAQDATAVASLNDRSAAGAYDLGDYLYAAAKAGLVNRIIWVVPESLGQGEQLLEAWRERLAEQRYPDADIATFTADGEAVSGTLHGVPVTITPITALRVGDQPVLLDIDMDYFTLFLPLNKYSNATGSVRDLVLGLRDAGVRPAYVTVATSNEGDFLPLQYRWMTDLLTLMIAQPSIIDESAAPERFTLAGDAVARELAGDAAGALDAWTRLTMRNPGDPAGWFGSGRSLLLTGKTDEGFAAVEKAVRLDGSYAYGYVQLAAELSQASRTEDALRCLTLAGNVDPFVVALRRGDVLYNAGRYDEAAKQYSRLAQSSSHPDVLMFLGDAYAASGKDVEALDAYERGEQALRAVTFRNERDYPDALPYLARLAADRGEADLARARWELYLELRPEGSAADTARSAIVELAR